MSRNTLSRRDVLTGIGASIIACKVDHRSTRAKRAQGAVASSQMPATEIGASILRAGGNAADAAIATAAALNVTEPISTGLGGDCFALYFEAATKKLTALNGSGRAPKRLTLELVRAQGITEMPPRHPHTVTVPGACAGWLDLLERHGTMSRAQVLEPAIALAEEGFAVGAVTSQFWAVNVERAHGAQNLDELMIDGRAPRGGERFRNPHLARALRAIVAGGKDAFYRGEIAASIVSVLGAAGGVMSLDDLAAHTSTWDEPISTTYRGKRIWECPPNGQGLTALLALNILEGFELAKLPPLSPARMHLMVEALRLAFADTRWYVTDPAKVNVPVAQLLAKDYAARRRRLIDPARATADIQRGSPTSSSDTVYFCVVDSAGNACSFINSNYAGLGTAIVPKGWGFSLQNRGHAFSLDPSHPNALAPGKRPYHTIIPGMITELDGSLYGPFGVMGGFMQPQGHVQVVVGLLDDAAEPQTVIDRPRFCIDPVDGAGEVLFEAELPSPTVDGMRALGHSVVGGVTGLDRGKFGRGQIIHRLADGEVATGSDKRLDGGARVV